MNRILILADSKKYVKNNCFQLQLHESIRELQRELQKEFQIDYFYLNPKMLHNLDLFRRKPNAYLFALSTLRQRVLFENISLVSKIIGDTPLRVYDQDPWESYIDVSPTNGCYSLLKNNFQISNIFVTSNYWANYIRDVDKVESTFVKMGMLPKLCSLGESKVNRNKSVEFKGSLHPHREQAFNRMRDSGQAVKINLGKLNYPGYLKYLQHLSIFVHDESGFWICNGKKIPRSTGMWVKDIEIASQGCFSIRNFYEDYLTYSIDSIPLVKFYKNPSEVKEIVEDIFSLSDDQYEAVQNLSVQYISNNNNWRETTKKLLKT
jgi:hypothetical protein